MRKTHIRRWLARPGHTQTQLADLTGLAQTSISKAVSRNREIYVVTEDDGEVWLQEVKRLRGARG